MKGSQRDFDKAAPTWDMNQARVKMAEDIARAMIREVAFGPDMDVLDFGCGTGLVTLKLASMVRSVTGADSSHGMLDVLKAKAESQGQSNVQTRLVHGGDALPGRYDVIVSSMTLHHIERVEPLLRQFFQVLRTPGWLCIADLDLDDGEFHGDNTGVFHNGFDRTELKRLLEGAGFCRIRDVLAAEMTKPGPKGDLRKFTVFLTTGSRTAI